MELNNVTTLVGTGQPGFKDGSSSRALLNKPAGLAFYPDGNLLVVDSDNNCVRKISPDGIVSTFAGSGIVGFKNGGGLISRFNICGYYAEIAIDQNGDAILADVLNFRIRKISKNGKVSTLAGTGQCGDRNGPIGSSNFDSPTGVAVDEDGNMYVSETMLHQIRKITTDGTISTFVGSGIADFADGQGTAASFNAPFSVIVDASGNVLVADKGNDLIRKISPAGQVTTLAGVCVAENETGNENSACLKQPQGMAVDGDGNIFVADSGNHRILRINSAGDVSVIAGTGERGFVNGPGANAQFDHPRGLAIDEKGNIVVTDCNNHCIRVIAAGLTPPLQWLAERKGNQAQALVNISGVVSNHMSAEKYSDMEIHVDGKIFPVHRLILSRCPFFAATFENECVESTQGKIVLNDMNADAFQLILEYLYNDKLNIPVECDALALRSAAEFLGLEDLERQCEIVIQKRLCVDNLVRCYRYAKVNSMNQLKRRCVSVASESIGTLTSVLLTKDYDEMRKSDEELEKGFLEECRSLRQK